MTESAKTLARQFLEAVEIMARLRSPGGCPWDLEQSHQTLKKYMIEEAYELLESIDKNDDAEMMEECGDVLLQVLFHARIAEEEGRFSIQDVLECLCEKLISRHPHVFGNAVADTAHEVLDRWEKLKRKEKPERTSILDGIPKKYPALMQAEKIQKKVTKIGFDWDHIDQVFDKFTEEWGEFREAHDAREPAKIEEELGDMLFALVNIARYVHVDPEEALKKTNQKFERRFRYIEETLGQQNKSLKDATLEEMDALWDKAKALEK
jgi:tetrapyrrole methylase family protein / MazG family protein